MSLTPTQELELQALSGASQRRNQPKVLTMLGVLLILIAGFFAFSSFGASTDAKKKAQRRSTSAIEIEGLIDRYNTLTQGGSEGGGLGQRFPVNTRIRSTLEASAENLGIDRPTITQRAERAGLDYPLQRQTLTTQISDAELKPTLKWINSATKNIDGLYVTGVEFSPTPGGWQIEVRYARWEVVQP